MPSLLAVLGLDSRPFKRELQSASMYANALGRKLAAGLSLGGLTLAGKKTVAFATQIRDMAARAGVGTEALQEMAYAAKQSGASLDDVRLFLEQVNVTRAKALSGNEELIQSFQRLGVSLDDLRKKRVEDLIRVVADKVKTSDIQAIVKELRDIGGRSATSLVAAFKAGLHEAGQAARHQGLVIRDEYIQRLGEIGDRFTDLSMLLVANLSPSISHVADGIEDLVMNLKILGAWLGAVSTITPREVSDRARGNDFDLRDVSQNAKEKGQSMLGSYIDKATSTGSKSMAEAYREVFLEKQEIAAQEIAKIMDEFSARKLARERMRADRTAALAASFDVEGGSWPSNRTSGRSNVERDQSRLRELDLQLMKDTERRAALTKDLAAAEANLARIKNFHQEDRALGLPVDESERLQAEIDVRRIRLDLKRLDERGAKGEKSGFSLPLNDQQRRSAFSGMALAYSNQPTVTLIDSSRRIESILNDIRTDIRRSNNRRSVELPARRGVQF